MFFPRKFNPYELTTNVLGQSTTLVSDPVALVLVHYSGPTTKAMINKKLALRIPSMFRPSVTNANPQ